MDQVPIPAEPGVPMPCDLYPECGFDCTWPDCVQDDDAPTTRVNALVPLVAMTVEAFLPILFELYNLPHALGRVWRVYRAKRAHHG